MQRTNEPPRSKKGLLILVIVIAVACIAVGAWYAEPIGYFVGLKMWDKAAPARTVIEFLSAGKEGKQTAADRLIGTAELKPLVKKDKWLGYQMNSIAGTVEYHFQDLSPQKAPEPREAEYILRGEGAAEVLVPNRAGKDVRYRLKMGADGWKIVEIRAGRIRSN